jgi:hypothetical protein
MAMELACIRSTLFFHISIAVPLYESYSITQLPVIPTVPDHHGLGFLEVIHHVDYHVFFQVGKIIVTRRYYLIAHGGIGFHDRAAA